MSVVFRDNVGREGRSYRGLQFNRAHLEVLERIVARGANRDWHRDRKRATEQKKQKERRH